MSFFNCILVGCVPGCVLTPRACPSSVTGRVIVRFPFMKCHDILQMLITRPLPFQTMFLSARHFQICVFLPTAMPVWVYRAHVSTTSSFCGYIMNHNFLIILKWCSFMSSDFWHLHTLPYKSWLISEIFIFWWFLCDFRWSHVRRVLRTPSPSARGSVPSCIL